MRLAIASILMVILPFIGVSPSLAQPPARTIMDTVAADPQFSTLTRALQAAGLTATLASDGPFTLWAPTNDAFTRLAPNGIDALLQDQQRLRTILTYHIASGAVTAAQAVQVPDVATIQGERINIRTIGSSVRMNDTNVIRVDVLASNGVIHVVDGVLMPPSQAAPSSLPPAGEALPMSPLPTALLGVTLVMVGITYARKRRAPQS